MVPQGVEPALRQFAREVDDPAADKIAMVLILRERNGGPGLAEVLTALATDLDDRSRMVREVEAERAKPRANMRTIVVVTLSLVVGMVLFARTFLSGYSTPLGQVALLADIALFGTALRWMRRLSDPPRPPRVLVRPRPGSGGSVTGLQMATLAGMLGAPGLLLGVRRLRSAPPSLPAALEQLSASPTAAGPGTTGTTPP